MATSSTICGDAPPLSTARVLFAVRASAALKSPCGAVANRATGGQERLEKSLGRVEVCYIYLALAVWGAGLNRAPGKFQADELEVTE